jgi:hypothetical protein
VTGAWRIHHQRVTVASDSVMAGPRL